VTLRMASADMEFELECGLRGSQLLKIRCVKGSWLEERLVVRQTPEMERFLLIHGNLDRTSEFR